MKSIRSSLFLALALAACGGTPATPDSGSANDAASPGDGGGAVDTGTTADVGTVADTGTVADDTGTAIDTGPGVDAAVDCAPRTFLISTPGFAYTFADLGVNPDLTLCAGVTYTFDTMDVRADHPMQLTQGGTLLMAVPAGALTTYTVPSSGAQPDAYSCVPHGFGGAIAIAP